jgi:hypothetical protein
MFTSSATERIVPTYRAFFQLNASIQGFALTLSTHILISMKNLKFPMVKSKSLKILQEQQPLAATYNCEPRAPPATQQFGLISYATQRLGFMSSNKTAMEAFASSSAINIGER